MKFHCMNAGHKSIDIFSSRVNDKICDCCDGSDEWNADVSCPNTCHEMGIKAQEEKRRLIELHNQGYQKRLDYSAQGKQKEVESHASLEEKEAELEVVKNELIDLEAAQEAAEEPERAAKEAHQKQWDEERASRMEDEDRADARFGFDELDTNSDGVLVVEELLVRYELDDDSDGDVSEEEALSYLDNQRSIDFETFYSSSWDAISDRCQFKRPTLPPVPVEKPVIPPVDSDEYFEEEDEDDEYDSDDEDDDDDDDVMENEEKMPDYDDATQELIAAADEARSARREADNRKATIEREINDLNKYLKISYGVDREFSHMYDQCYEFTDREYTYKMCAFGKVTQRAKSGGRETNLGTWGKWNGPANNIYSVMRYEDGEKCWNGPSRSATISLICGLEDQLLSASEPNRCEYVMTFSTPAVCEASKHTSHTEL